VTVLNDTLAMFLCVSLIREILLVGDSRWYKQVAELNTPYAIAADYVLVDIFCMWEYYLLKFIMLLFTRTILIGM